MGTESTTEAVDVAQPVTASASEVLTREERAERMAALEKVMGLMRPAVQQDGGDLVLVDADVAPGVERILRARLPWVTEVIGTVDDSIDFLDSAALGRGGYVPRSQP